MIDAELQLPEELRAKLALEELTYTQESLARAYNGIYNRCFKRAIDFTLALIGLLVVWPVMLVLALAVAIETGFPVLYRPLRGGYRGKAFRINKFRTMVKNADQIGGGTTALNDSRITRVGAFLRKTKLDETAQLLNVLSGTMSFVGERDIIVTTKKNIVFSRVVTANSVSL